MQHVADYNLSYGTMEEFSFRHELFGETHAEIMAINSDPASTHTAGHNFLSTWTEQEKKRMLGYQPHGLEDHERDVTMLPEANASSVDWRNNGYVNAVQDQG
jgi:hypothetical protein